MRVEVIGGGPGGMYTARLLKLRHPDWEVRVHERNAPDATFGFGIGLSPVTLGRMERADRATFDGLMDLGHDLSTWTMRIGRRSISGGNNRSIGLHRAGMLRVLADHAEAAGVTLEWGRYTTLDDVADADLVVAAEGAGSPTRTALAEYLGVTIEHGDLAYIWCGADIAPDSMLFEVVEDERGVYVAHVMAYDDGHSTFQIDTRRTTIHGGRGATDEQGNDRVALDHLAELYADVLGGTPLRGNRSAWSTFDTVRCERWSYANVVLIGDAAHTAHYSVGSGTRMAMEDALALVDAFDGGTDVPTALRAYEQRRRPSADRLQDRAVRSQSWWHAYPDRMHLPMAQLMANYMTRTGAVGAVDLATSDDALFASSLGELSALGSPADDDAIARVLNTPLELTRVLPTRLLGGAPLPAVDTTPVVRADDPAATADAGADAGAPDAVGEVPADVDRVAEARARHPGRVLVAIVAAGDQLSPEAAVALQAAGADVVQLAVPAGPDAVLTTLDLAEQIRLRGVTVAVMGTAHDLDALCAGVLAGRLDLVTIGAEVPA